MAGMHLIPKELLRVGLAVALLAGCEHPAAPEFDWSFGGPCVPEAPTTGLVGAAEVSLTVTPPQVGYGTQYVSELTIHNVGLEEIRVEPQMEYCVQATWLRGAKPLYDPVCVANAFYLAADAETRHGTAGEFRYSGPRFATSTEPGVRADPGTYCVSVMFRLESDSILLEAPLELVGP